MKRSILLLLLFLSGLLVAQDKQLIFKSTHNADTFSIRMADAYRLKLKNGKVKIGLICGYTSTSICFKQRSTDFKKINKEFKELNRDKSLNSDQRFAAFLKILYPDSVMIPYDSIKKIKFFLAGDKRYRTQTRIGSYLFYASDIAMLALLAETGNYPIIKSVFVIIPVVYAASIVNCYFAFHKTLRTCDWKLKPLN